MRSRAGSCAAGRARARTRRRWPRPGARSRRRGRSACAATSPSARLIAPAERRVHDELHAAASRRRSARTRSSLGRQRAERGVRRGEVGAPPALRRGVGSCRARPRAPARAAAEAARHELRVDVRAQRGDLARQLAVRAGASPSQNGTVGGAPPRVAHAHDARLDAADAPRGAAEQEHVARHALDRPVFVDGADEGVVGVGDHAVVGDLGDRAARGERGEPRAAPAAQHAVHAIAVHVRGAATAPGLDTLRDAARAPRRSRSRASCCVRARRGAPARRAPPRSSRSAAHAATICCARMSSGATRRVHASSSPARTRAQQRRALDELVARRRDTDGPSARAPRAWPERPTRWSNVAMLRGEPS